MENFVEENKLIKIHVVNLPGHVLFVSVENNSTIGQICNHIDDSYGLLYGDYISWTESFLLGEVKFFKERNTIIRIPRINDKLTEDERKNIKKARVSALLASACIRRIGG